MAKSNQAKWALSRSHHGLAQRHLGSWFPAQSCARHEGFSIVHRISLSHPARSPCISVKFLHQLYMKQRSLVILYKWICRRRSKA